MNHIFSHTSKVFIVEQRRDAVNDLQLGEHINSVWLSIVREQERGAFSGQSTETLDGSGDRGWGWPLLSPLSRLSATVAGQRRQALLQEFMALECAVVPSKVTMMRIPTLTCERTIVPLKLMQNIIPPPFPTLYAGHPDLPYVTTLIYLSDMHNHSHIILLAVLRHYE